MSLGAADRADAADLGDGAQGGVFVGGRGSAREAGGGAAGQGDRPGVPGGGRLMRVEGLMLDGQPATPETLIAVGAEELSREALAAVKAGAGSRKKNEKTDRRFHFLGYSNPARGVRRMQGNGLNRSAGADGWAGRESAPKAGGWARKTASTKECPRSYITAESVGWRRRSTPGGGWGIRCGEADGAAGPSDDGAGEGACEEKSAWLARKNRSGRERARAAT